MLSDLRGFDSLRSNSSFGLNESQDAVKRAHSCPMEPETRIFHSSFSIPHLSFPIGQALRIQFPEDKWQMIYGK
jgi:hypothetical protein